MRQGMVKDQAHTHSKKGVVTDQCCAVCMQLCSAFVTYLEQGQMRSTHAVLRACRFVQHLSLI